MLKSLSTLPVLALATSLITPMAFSAAPIVCLMTKTDIDPFFMKIKEGAYAQ